MKEEVLFLGRLGKMVTFVILTQSPPPPLPLPQSWSAECGNRGISAALIVHGLSRYLPFMGTSTFTFKLVASIPRSK